jgi:transposase-like protein
VRRIALDQARRYSTVAERRQMAELFDKSGMTQKDFAAEHRLTLSTLTRWLRATRGGRGNDQQQANTAGVQFHSLAFPAAAAWTAEVQLPNGATVRFNANTTPELAAAILRASR